MKTSSASARSSGRSTPEPSSRDRKAARRPKRVPGGAIEEPTRARCDEPAPPELIRGIEQFNAGEFFQQHETLELLWRDTTAPVRGLYHGILQVGVGFHHWRGRNFHGASVLLEPREGPAGWRSVVTTREAGQIALWQQKGWRS